MAIFVRRDEDLAGLVHHSDRGVQYTAIRYAQRLAEERAIRSVGSKGDSFDNAAAEALNSLYKRELIDPKNVAIQQASAACCDTGENGLVIR
jgi:putative transposase